MFGFITIFEPTDSAQCSCLSRVQSLLQSHIIINGSFWFVLIHSFKHRKFINATSQKIYEKTRQSLFLLKIETKVIIHKSRSEQFLHNRN